MSKFTLNDLTSPSLRDASGNVVFSPRKLIDQSVMLVCPAGKVTVVYVESCTIKHIVGDSNPIRVSITGKVESVTSVNGILSDAAGLSISNEPPPRKRKIEEV